MTHVCEHIGHPCTYGVRRTWLHDFLLFAQSILQFVLGTCSASVLFLSISICFCYPHVLIRCQHPEQNRSQKQTTMRHAQVLRGPNAYTHLEASKSPLYQHGVYFPDFPHTRDKKQRPSNNACLSCVVFRGKGGVCGL